MPFDQRVLIFRSLVAADKERSGPPCEQPQCHAIISISCQHITAMPFGHEVKGLFELNGRR